MPELFDTHTHIHFPIYDKDREEIIKRAQAAGVKMICVGTQASTSELAIKLAEKNPNDIWAAVGFHPNHLADHWHHDKKEQEKAVPEKFDIKGLGELAKHPKVVAIGECGLDYYRLNKNPAPEGRPLRLASSEARGSLNEIERQKEVFIEQINLAESLGKTLMMHTRPSAGTNDAYEDTLDLISDLQLSIPKVNHFYVGSLAITKKLLDAGFYFTFGGVITFARDYDDVLKYTPLDRILLETDAPYVAPEPYRGRRNEPSYIVETARKLAEIKDISYEKVAEQTTLNALKVFHIKV